MSSMALGRDKSYTYYGHKKQILCTLEQKKKKI